MRNIKNHKMLGSLAPIIGLSGFVVLALLGPLLIFSTINFASAQLDSERQITQVNWLDEANSSALLITVQGQQSAGGVTNDSLLMPSIASFAKGTHLKVTFDQAYLISPIAKLSARGRVKAAFVTQSYSGSQLADSVSRGRVNVDLFLTHPGGVKIDHQANGVILHIVDQAATMNQAKYAQQADAGQSTGMHVAPKASFFEQNKNTSASTQNSQASKGLPGLSQLAPVLLSDGTGAVELRFNGAIPDLTHFQMSSPPRVVVDMANTANRSGQLSFDINRGLFASAKAVRSGNRLRLIFDLKQAARFEIDAIDLGYRLKAYGASPIMATRLKQYPTSQPAALMAQTPLGGGSQKTSKPSAPSKPASIAGVDFRRTTDGHGRVIVQFNEPGVIVNFDKRGGELVAVFVNATLNSKDERRLDVVDFATPVETVDLIRRGANVQLVVTPQGQYKHSTTQTDNEYIIDISPLSKREILALEESTTGYKGEALSLNFQSIPVRAALQVIADFTGLNIITSDSVKGDLSLRLNDVPWDQALDLILQTKNLSMRQTGNVIRVAPAAELAAQEKRAFEAQQEVGELEPLVTDLIRVHYAKAEDIAALLKSVKAVDTGIRQTGFGSLSLNELKTEENSLLSSRGSVTVDVRTNTLLIQDTTSRIRELRVLIDKLDVPVKQIQIETRIVEATDDFSRSLGARLGFLRVTDNAQLPGTTDNNSIGTIFGSGNIENNSSVRTDNVILYPDDLSINLPADPLNGESPASYAYQIVKIGAGYLNLLDLEISALQAEGKGKIIANPKIITTDKHEARIEQGQERVFSSSSLLQGGTTTKKAVLSLVVTPQVTPDDQIILDVKITNDSFAASDTLNTKQIETQTLLRNGETVVIGGIYQQAQADSITKTPILGDIPILGNLFKKRTKRDNRTELLIFLTPRIINPDFR